MRLASGALVLAVLVSGTAGGAYLYLHETDAAVAPRSVEVKRALKSLKVALPGQPATALVPRLCRGGMAVLPQQVEGHEGHRLVAGEAAPGGVGSPGQAALNAVTPTDRGR